MRFEGFAEQHPAGGGGRTDEIETRRVTDYPEFVRATDDLADTLDRGDEPTHEQLVELGVLLRELPDLTGDAEDLFFFGRIRTAGELEKEVAGWEQKAVEDPSILEDPEYLEVKARFEELRVRATAEAES